MSDESIMDFTQVDLFEPLKESGLKDVIITFKDFEMDKMESEIHALLSWAVAEAKANNKSWHK